MKILLYIYLNECQTLRMIIEENTILCKHDLRGLIRQIRIQNFFTEWNFSDFVRASENKFV